ncbi:MAG: hypothetical protein FWJ87_13350 [Micromonosporaceae bacterium]
MTLVGREVMAMVSPAGDAPAGGTEPAGRPAVPGAGTIALLALVWLTVTVAGARLQVERAFDGSALSLARPLFELPQVVTACLVAGTAVTLVARQLPAGRAGHEEAGRRRAAARLGVAVVAGLAPGAGVAVPALLAYRDLPYLPALAGAMVGAALLGGLVAALPARTAVAAGVVGALGATVVAAVVGRFEPDLRRLFGAGDGPGAVLTASGRVVLVSGLLAGLVAGAAGYAYLRRADRGARWPAYLAAGALPGVLTLLGEAVARAGAAALVRLIGEASPADGTVWTYLAAVRINHGMVVLFAGALVAILLLGHLRPRAGSGSAAASDGSAEGASAEAAAQDRS